MSVRFALFAVALAACAHSIETEPPESMVATQPPQGEGGSEPFDPCPAMCVDSTGFGCTLDVETADECITRCAALVDMCAPAEVASLDVCLSGFQDCASIDVCAFDVSCMGDWR